MAIQARCPHCSKVMRAADSHAGKRVRCPQCRQVLQLPAAARTGGGSPRRSQAPPDPWDAAPQYPHPTTPGWGGSSPYAAYPSVTPPAQVSIKKNQLVLLWSAGLGAAVVICAVVVGVFVLMESDWTSVDAVAGNQPADQADAQPPAAPLVVSGPTPASGGPHSTQHADVSTAPVDQPAAVTATSGPPARHTSPALGNGPAPAPVNGGEELPLAELVERAGNAVVLISMRDAAGQELGMGSGFLIDRSGLVATNFHVIEQGQTAVAQFRDGTEVEVAGVRAWDEDRDLAILQLASVPEQAGVLKLASEKPASGTPLVAIGHPRGFRFSTTTGIVSAVHTTEQLPEDIRLSMNAPDDQVWIQTNTVIAPGSSGGPLLNRRGEVVGINTWVTLDVPFGFASHAQHLTDLMARLNPQPTPVAEVNGHKATIALMSGLGEDELDPEVKALTLELKRKTEEHVAALLEAGSPRELQALERRNPLGEYVQKFLALAREKRQTPAAYQALAISLVWAPRITPESAGRRIVEEASEQLLRDHLEETSLAVVALALSETTWTESRSLLQKFSEHSPHRGVQGAACLGLALSLTRSERRPGQEDEANDEVVRLLERVVGEYGDVVIGDRELAEIAEPLLYRFKYLVVGREAPEISGQDIDGETFQLSEYRGRVVVLDFFADWCPYCARMYPHERLLVERYKDRPFVLLGVNTDEESRLRRILDERKVTWRTWADGPGGEIANRWNVRSYPTIFILDHEGVIRHHFRGTPDPDEFGRAIEQLVRRAEADQRRRPSRSREDRPADEPVVEEPVVDPTGRFLDHGAYVEDTQTGLLWQKDGDASGKRNFYEAAEYAEKLKLGGLTDWRVPTKEELAAIFPAVTPPFQDTKYTPEPCCGGPHERDTFAYWTSNLDPGVEDYAYVYQWYADGGANNGFASKNYVYVRCVHDPVNNDSAEN